MYRIRLLTFVAIVAIPCAASLAGAERLPNIVILLADDLGYGELGCYGQEWIKTPHLDQLAKQGMRFTDFYAGNAVCAPSRCCLMTGKHPGQAYIRGNGDPRDLQYLGSRFGWEFPGQNPIPDSEVTLAEILKAQGYATAAIGKWGLGHFGTSGDPNRQGFDLFYGFNCQRHAHNHYPKFLWRNHHKELLPGNDRTLHGDTYSQDRFTDVALSFIRDHADEPFFLYMPFAIPHLSIQVPESSLAEYRDQIPEADYQHRGYLKHPHLRAGYAAMISHLDRDIGRILKQLDELGLDENTLVIFTSDNGPTFDRLGGSDSDFFDSADGLRARKGSLYEGGIRVPMIARWPGKIPADSKSAHIAAFWDVLPTIAELTAAQVPATVTGHSFAAALQGQQNAATPFLYWEFPAYGGQQAIRQGNWKAIRQGMMKARNLDDVELELYDLSVDRQETQNVASSYPDVARRLSALMSAARTPNPIFPFPVLDQVGRESVAPAINKNFVRPKIQVEEWQAKFEVESREVFRNRDKIVAAVNLNAGDVIADIGAGTGLFTFPFATAVGDQGQVLAVDISKGFLQHIVEKSKDDQIDNITTVQCRADTTKLSANSIDKAFICDTYHHFEFPAATLGSIHNALRPNGELVIIDFRREPNASSDWVLNHVRAGKATFQQEIEQAGFQLLEEVNLPELSDNYFLRFRRR